MSFWKNLFGGGELPTAKVDPPQVRQNTFPIMVGEAPDAKRLALRHVGRIMRNLETLKKGTLSPDAVEQRRKSITQRRHALAAMGVSCPNELEAIRELYEKMGGE